MSPALRTLCVAALLGTAAPAFAHPDPEDPATAHFLANEAILVVAGETKLLFDPLFSTSYGYPLVDPETRAQIMAGEAPYDGVDVILVSHVHGDHFDAAAINAYLAAHPEVLLVAPAQAAGQLQLTAGWDPAFSARIHAIAFDEEIREMSLPANGVADAVRIDTVYIPHAGNRPHIQNMTYRVTLNEMATVMHMGDATPEPAIYVTHAEFFGAQTTHRAFPPFWIIGEWGEAVAQERLNADTVTGIHAPISRPGWMLFSTGDFFIQPGETRSVGEDAHGHDE